MVKTGKKMGKPKTGAGKSVGETTVRLKVTLLHLKPPVWRRLVMPGAMTLGDLHQAIQAAMGWHDSHLHSFDIAGQQYGDPDIVDDVEDEHRLTLKRVVKSGVARFTYTYDFGDDWQHLVAIEKAEPSDREASHPVCIAGARNCPPEDCGGPFGYEDLLAALADPAHPEHAEKRRWVGGKFDRDCSASKRPMPRWPPASGGNSFGADPENHAVRARLRKGGS